MSYRDMRSKYTLNLFFNRKNSSYQVFGKIENKWSNKQISYHGKYLLWFKFKPLPEMWNMQ